jgi:cysteine desulfurase
LRHVYLDWNATTPPHPDVLAAMRDAAATAWANPASVHGPGRRARALVEAAREAVAALVGSSERDVTLTSGGTEANNLALAAPFADDPAGGALVVSALEHPSIARAAEALAARGVAVEIAAPSREGAVEPAAIADAIERAERRGRLRLVALQAVSHETGVVQPVGAAAELAHARGALVLVDAVQAAGKLAPDAWAGADLVTIAAHKIRGPKGIGALATRPRVRLAPLLRGGAQEKGLRPGTQDPVAAAGLAVAAERARATPASYASLSTLRDNLEDGLARLGERHGAPPLRNGTAPRAPHVTNLSFPGWLGPELCAALDLEGVAVSSGSACSAGTAEPSPVILAMVGEARARSAVRVSLGDETSSEAIEAALCAWDRVLERGRAAPRAR